MESKYIVTTADLRTDKGSIVAIWGRGLDGLVGAVAETKYRRYYLDNPSGNGTCLLLHTAASGELIGVQGLIPRTFYIGPRRIRAATLADYVVVSEHRSLGPALKLMRASVVTSREQFAFVYGTPNEKSHAILKRSGLSSLGVLTRYTKVIRSGSFWRSRLPHWIVPPLAALVDVLIAIVDISRGWLYARHVTWSEQNSFGAEFDKIWKDREGELVVGERSPSVLHWRYPALDSDSQWHLSLAMDPSKAPIGYVVWRQHEGIALVSDFFCSNVDSATKALLQSFAGYVRQFPVQRVSLEFFGHERVVRALVACGFAARDRSPIAIVEHLDKETNMRQVSPDSMYLTSFDRDHES